MFQAQSTRAHGREAKCCSSASVYYCHENKQQKKRGMPGMMLRPVLQDACCNKIYQDH